MPLCHVQVTQSRSGPKAVKVLEAKVEGSFVTDQGSQQTNGTAPGGAEPEGGTCGRRAALCTSYLMGD